MRALPWPLGPRVRVEAVAEDGRVLGREPARQQGEAIAVTYRRGVFQYRLVSE